MNAIVTVIVDGIPTAGRSWPFNGLPRQADYVEIDVGSGKFVDHLVTKVVWRRGVEPGECRVDVHCKVPKVK